MSPTCPHPLHIAIHPTTSPITDFTSRCTNCLLVYLARCHRKGTIRAEFLDTPQLTRSTLPAWTDPIRPLLRPSCYWSIYTDASWRAVNPIPVEAVFGIQGSHIGSGTLFLFANLPNWPSETMAIRFDIPPTLHSLGGSTLVAELIAIHTGLHLLHSL